MRLLADLVRDVFGHLIGHVEFFPDWLSAKDATVMKIAGSVHDEQAFDQLPILADALEDAGCFDARVLSHLRSSQTHVRGCWVVDALLGKD